jgi:uncharacterized protein (UPF0216 family)
MIREYNREDRLLKKQILSLNRHLPRRRKTLAELSGEEKPHVVGTDGTRHRFKKEELERVGAMISEGDHGRLKLPIYIEIEAETSGARISGTLESSLICQILEKENCRGEIFIYRPEIRIIRRELPTTTQYMFLAR